MTKKKSKKKITLSYDPSKQSKRTLKMLAEVKKKLEKQKRKSHAPALYPRKRRKGKRTEVYIPSFTRNGKRVKGFWRKK